MTIKLHHISLIVGDTEAALKFYKSVFDLPQIQRKSADGSPHRGAWLRLGEIELHLQERKGSHPKTEQHLALVTDQLEKIQQRALALGGRSETARLIEGVQKRCFVYDPDGNRIELMEL